MAKYYFSVSIIGVFVLVVCIIGFLIVGSPISQQAIQLDSMRVSDFSQIKYAVESYSKDNGKLPELLMELQPKYLTRIMQDPGTSKLYEYKTVTNTVYDLCTTFSTDSDQLSKSTRQPIYTGENQNKHKKGYSCIEYSVNLMQNNYNYPSLVLTLTPALIPSSILSPTPTMPVHGLVKQVSSDTGTVLIFTGTYVGPGPESQEFYLNTIKEDNTAGNVLIAHNKDNTNTVYLDKDNNKITFKPFVLNEKLRVEAPIIRGNTYQTGTIQYLSR